MVSSFKQWVSLMGLIALIAICLMPALASASTIHVPAGYSTIGAAINAASPGDTILVDSGTYKESLQITKALTLKGVDIGGGLPVVEWHGDNASNISADGVSLQGFNLTGASYGVLIHSGNNNVSGNTISNCWLGVNVADGTGSNILSSNVFKGNSGAAIYITSSPGNTIAGNSIGSNNGDGVAIYYSRNNRITTNTVNSCNHAFYLINADNNTLAGNTGDRNWLGIELAGSSYDNVTGNRFNGSAMAGIRLDAYGSGTSAYDLLSGNTLENGFTFGIHILDCSNNVLRNNRMNGNLYDFADASTGAIQHNDVDTSNLVEGRPIYYLVGASNRVIDGTSNAGTVYLVNCSNMTVKDLVVTASDYCGVCLIGTTGTRIVNVTAINDNIGIALYASCNNTVTGNTLYNDTCGIALAGVVSSGSDHNSVSGNTINNNAAEGISIANSAFNSVSGNMVNGNSGDGFVISYACNNTVTDNAVNNDYHAFSLTRADNNTIAGNTVGHGYYGFELLGSSYNNITGNRLTTFTFDGVLLMVYGGWTSEYNLFSGNTVDNCTEYGMYLMDCSDNVLRGNRLSGNGCNFGDVPYNAFPHNDVDTSNLVEGRPIYYLVGASNRVIDGTSNAGLVYLVDCSNITLRDLTLTAKDYYGIYLEGTTGSRIVNVTVANATYGIELYGSGHNTVTGNTVHNNTYGIDLTSNSLYGSDYNNVSGNEAYDNAYKGIGLYYGSFNIVSGNVVEDNGQNGIVLDRSNDNRISGNMLRGDANGINICNLYSINNLVSGNIVSNNSQSGIILHGSNAYGNSAGSNNTATDNTIEGSGWYAIDGSGDSDRIVGNQLRNNYLGILFNGHHCVISGNTINNNFAGANLAGDANEFIGNTVNDNTGDGIGSTGTNWNISGNTANHNGQNGIYNCGQNNAFSGNTVRFNGKGFCLAWSSGNVLWLNRIGNNTVNAQAASGGVNYWNSTVPISYSYNGVSRTNYTGNYWGDYQGADKNSDGIGDTPYQIDANDIDRYPMLADASGPAVAADFTANVTSGFAPLTVAFTDASSGSPASWQWNFGDGSSNVTSRNAMHTYQAAGNYTAILTVSDGTRSSSASKVIQVTPATPAQSTYSLALGRGWNLVSLPLQNDSSWASGIPAGSGVDRVAAFNGNNQTFSVYYVGQGGQDIRFVPDKGYFINCTLDHATLTFYGVPADGPRSLALYPGWNLVGWAPSHNTTAKAFGALGPGIGKVARYNGGNASYSTYIVGTSRDDRSFSLDAGSGYFVYSNSSSTIEVNI